MTTNPTSAAPACKFDEGCHRVVACDPGCAVAAAELHRRLAVPAGRDALRTALAAVLDLFPADLHPNGPAVRSRHAPTGLILRWRDLAGEERDEQEAQAHLDQLADELPSMADEALSGGDPE